MRVNPTMNHNAEPIATPISDCEMRDNAFLLFTNPACANPVAGVYYNERRTRTKRKIKRNQGMKVLNNVS